MTPRAWDTIRRYSEANAQHWRKGYRLGEVTVEFILAAAADELQELREAPTDISEMADVMACLIHACQRQGWSPSDIGAEIERKLELRFGSLEENMAHAQAG